MHQAASDVFDLIVQLVMACDRLLQSVEAVSVLDGIETSRVDL